MTCGRAKADSAMRAGATTRGLRGFTMIELVVTLIIVGILAVVALPRMMGRGEVDPATFHDSTLALLRYAQKSAIAQRRNVCVTFTAASATLNMAATRGDGVVGCAIALAGPDGKSPAAVTAPSSATGYAPVPAAITFRARGDIAVAANPILITGASSIAVERTTGYVH